MSKKETTEVAIAEKEPFNQAQIDLIKSQIAAGATDDELKYFLNYCKRTGLDPLTRQIYFQKRKQKNYKTGEYEYKMVIITSIDGYRLVAARTGEHSGTDDAVFDDEAKPNKATVSVYRLVKGVRSAFTASARWNEYCPDAPSDKMWRRMPCTMLAKVAEALALRKAFPNDLGGLYTNDEMAQAGKPDEESTEPKWANSVSAEVTKAAAELPAPIVMPLVKPNVPAPTTTTAQKVDTDKAAPSKIVQQQAVTKADLAVLTELRQKAGISSEQVLAHCFSSYGVDHPLKLSWLGFEQVCKWIEGKIPQRSDADESGLPEANTDFPPIDLAPTGPAQQGMFQ